ncbi:trimethylamine methyltransferase family protein [Taklimakanibacter lacteus]|uniref:trimethylamine methyltransferase family protein n=1 Tax=Taklimakanibacter lacteus TaxID=2268456 RepID=UPI000E67036F
MDIAGPDHKRRRRPRPGASGRMTDYTRLANPFDPIRVFSDDQVEAIHQNALRILQDIGMRVLHMGGRARLKAAGASVDEETMIVRFDKGLVESALASAPRTIELAGGTAARNVTLGGRNVAFLSVAGAPHASDIDNGKRPGTLADLENFVRLTQSFPILHMLAAVMEPQDVPVHLRHYATMRAALTLSDKVPWVFCRGAGQVRDSFEMVRIARGLSPDEFSRTPCCYTVINTNSPLQLDVPMTQGLIDFAEAGQVLIATPFCLAGAMAPITIAGALSLQHAEALAAITLYQIVRPGAPILYGSFASNVDMRSGSPAFGTPEHVKTSFGAGQLARRIGLPWRSSAGTASNAPDVQADYETQMSVWGAVMAGCNVLLHGAGWLEGGLTASFEKLITDLELLQSFAEMFQPVSADEDDLAFDAIRDVGPGGHFFATQHTMQRYQTAFYEPLVSDWSNFGRWTETGAKTATERANRIWKQKLADFEAPGLDIAVIDALDDFIARRTREGGAPIDA